MQRMIKKLESAYIKTNLPAVKPGDTIKVITKVIEEGKSRLQVFQGVVISIQGEGTGKTIKVRKISYGVGVERTFPLHSPNIDSLEIVKKGSPRRAKLFYLRSRVGKRALKVKSKSNDITQPVGSNNVNNPNTGSNDGNDVEHTEKHKAKPQPAVSENSTNISAEVKSKETQKD